jgi:RNA polymerase sigma factor (sigma-70 family)
MTAMVSIRIDALKVSKARSSVFLEGRDGLTDWDRDFFTSEAALVLSEALNDYDSGKNGSIVSFCEFRIENRLKNSVRKESRGVGITPPVMERDEAHRAEVKSTFEYILSQLKGVSRKIFYLYFVEDKTMAEIGRILGISKAKVSGMLSGRIKNRVKQVLDG